MALGKQRLDHMDEEKCFTEASILAGSPGPISGPTGAVPGSFLIDYRPPSGAISGTEKALAPYRKKLPCHSAHGCRWSGQTSLALRAALLVSIATSYKSEITGPMRSIWVSVQRSGHLGKEGSEIACKKHLVNLEAFFLVIVGPSE